MIQTRQIGRHTEIYVPNQNGGGKSETYITQSKTTVFHDFWTRKILAAGETAADFREVTEAEKTKLQKARDEWEEPPQWFINLWDEACGVWGRYNVESGYFELNGLTDITYAQAMNIYLNGAILSYDCAGMYHNNYLARTNLPRRVLSQVGYNTQGFDIHNFARLMEVLNLEPYLGEDPNGFLVDIRKGESMASRNFASLADNELSNPKMKRIIGVFDLRLITTRFDALCFCSALEEVRIKRNACSMRLANCNSLSYASVNYLVENADTAKARNILVHANVYAKLTGTDTTLTEEEAAQWQALVPLAAEKGITFTT